MKRIINSILAVSAISFAIASCQETLEQPVDEIVKENTHVVSFIASADEPESKTSVVEKDGKAVFSWGNEDWASKFHIFENNTIGSVSKASINADGKMELTASFTGGTAPFVYSGYYSNGSMNDKVHPYVKDVQTMRSGKYDYESDILVIKPTEPTENTQTALSLQFKRIVAVNKMTLKGMTLDDDEYLTSVTITSDKAIAGTYDWESNTWEANGKTITITPDKTPGNNVVYFVSAPVSEAMLKVDVKTNKGAKYTKTFAKEISFKSGSYNTFGVTVAEDSPVPPTPVELFYESFNTNDGAGGNDDTWDGDIARNNLATDNEGWVFVKGNGANKCAKFGSGSAKGSATTPSIECTGDIILTFKAAAWNGSNESTTLNISATSGAISEASVTLVKAEWTEYTITISGVETSTQITFEAANKTNNRFFLDEVKVVAAAPDTRTALSTPTNLAVTGKIVSWTAVENAGSYLLAIGGNAAVEVNTNSYDAAAIDDEYYDVSVVAVPSDTDTYKNSVAATVENACFGTPTLTSPVLSEGTVDESSISVTWTMDKRAVNGYDCELFSGDVKVGESQTVKVGKVTFTNLNENVTYTVKVKAVAVSKPLAYAASEIASKDVKTKAAQHVSSITGAGSYTIKGLSVMAVISTSAAVLKDDTGCIYLYKLGHGLKVGQVVTAGGSVTVYGTYGNLLEFNSPTITITDENENEVSHGTAVEATEAYLSNYKGETLSTLYIHAKGQQNGRVVTIGTQKLYLSEAKSATDKKDVEVYGYIYGTGSNGVQLYAVDIHEDPTAPKLSVEGDKSKTWAWNNADAFVVNVNVANGSWTVSPTTLDWATVAANTEKNTLTITPKGQNTSDAKHTGTLTIKHSARETLTVDITLAQEFQPTCTAPVISCQSNKVSISAEEGATILYSTDGTTPSTEYNGEFEISETVTVKAIATKEGYKNSAEASKECVYVDPSAVKEYTLTITTSDFNTKSYAENNNEKTSTATTADGQTMNVKWTSNQVMQMSSVMQWQSSKGYIYNSTDLGKIKRVTVNSSAGTFTTNYGTSEHPTSGTTVGNGFFTVKVGSATGKTSSIVIVFEK